MLPDKEPRWRSGHRFVTCLPPFGVADHRPRTDRSRKKRSEWTIEGRRARIGHPQMTERPDLTALLSEWGRGNANALNELLPLVYTELRRIAADQLRREHVGHTL